MSETEPHSALTRLRQVAEGMTPPPWRLINRYRCQSQAHGGDHVVFAIDPAWGASRSADNAAGIVTAVSLLRALTDPGVREECARAAEPVLFRRALYHKLEGETLNTSLEVADAVLEWLASSAMKGLAE